MSKRNNMWYLGWATNIELGCPSDGLFSTPDKVNCSWHSTASFVVYDAFDDLKVRNFPRILQLWELIAWFFSFAYRRPKTTDKPFSLFISILIYSSIVYWSIIIVPQCLVFWDHYEPIIPTDPTGTSGACSLSVTSQAVAPWCSRHLSQWSCLNRTGQVSSHPRILGEINPNQQ